jgi:hypothetical protein
MSPDNPDPDQVFTFQQWCAINGLSVSTGRRIVDSGDGPAFVQFSERRKGVTRRENARWRDARIVKVPDTTPT